MNKMVQFGGVLISMLLLLSAPPAVAEEGIPIGVAGPFTGAYAAFGEQLWRGAEQAANDINAAGGINGKKIELFKGDDACEPKQALAVANQLVDRHGVRAVIGHFCSSSTIPASEVYAEAGILHITPASTNPMVTERGITTLFRTCGRDDQQGSTGANFIVNTLKANAIAVIHDKDTYGQGLADAMRTQLQRLGKKEVLYEGLTRGEKDFNALVTKFKSVNAEAVYFGGLHNEAGPLVRQMKEQGLKAPLVSGDGIVSEEFVIAAGGPAYAEGVYMTFGRDPRKIKEGQEVVDRLRKSGFEPEGYTLYSYATMQIVAAAIAATRGTDGAALAKWLHTHDVPTVMGSKGWDEKGDLKTSDYVMYRWNNKGSYEEVP
ncbi:MAG: branched-chain amino acid ABC transporter substrate-binding protein [Magnetococcales bacterium]|nr:branched-chain amino acid ABC transporter substrate-binding protein [Magnetococcales bacterium]MBF0150417.1 branched-chain amino acid ABC transporter substrate-binding protein [Magnetococcales bacterium]MBF0173955.1 branched-chain amino acid ABC transporter substrate-binding protein [Magnetococcales bacterium]MBF0346811.1 branched-chain amino acid ABC transporter substrate-binding protein [Magnetococcales bacterium]MBF0632135.1 branched-chain amino acid ABC transporter substrate-binding prot